MSHPYEITQAAKAHNRQIERDVQHARQRTDNTEAPSKRKTILGQARQLVVLLLGLTPR